VDDAVRVTLAAEQVNVAGTAMLALGGVIFCVTALDVLAVQPLTADVTVTVYVPVVPGLIVAAVAPVLHK
jgi:hypothetical protein